MRPAAASKVSVGLAALICAGLGLTVYGQGFDFLSDGRWLLGARTWLRDGALFPHLAVSDGPGRYAFVVPFYGLMGQSAAALAVAKAVSTAICAGAGLVIARRAGAGAGAWLVVAGTLVLGPIAPSLTAIALLVCAAAGDPHRRSGALLVAAAVTGAFGLAAALVAATLSTSLTSLPATTRVRGAMAAGLGLAVSLIAAAGADLPLAMATLAAQAGNIAHAITADGPGHPWLAALRGSWAVPFSGVATGEALAPLFGGHAAWRQGAAAAWALLSLATLAAAWRERRAPTDRRAATVVLTMASLAWLVSAEARQAAWIATLWLWPGLLASLERPRRTAAVTAVLALATLGPDLLEAGWLSTHAQRPGLRVWDRPSARVTLAGARIDHWESIFAALDRSSGPVLVWPNRPGVPVLFDLDLPTRQATLLVGEPVDTPGVIEELETSQPATTILALGDALATTRLRQHWPSLWGYLRGHYRVAGNLATGDDPVRLLHRLPDDPNALDGLTLPERLADVEIPVSNEAGPAMRPGLSVGQSIIVGETDLRGFSVRWRTAGRPVDVPARVRVWQRRGDEYDALLEFLDLQLVIPSDGYRSFLRFAQPISDTAGLDLAITIELREDPGDEIRLLWNRHDASTNRDDVYVEGTAVVNRRPVPADLYFFSY